MDVPVGASRVARWIVQEVEGTFALTGLYALTFSPSDISAMTLAAAALVTALGTAIASIMASRRVETLVQDVKTEAKVITGHVNSSATAAAKKIESLEEQIRFMRAEMADKKQIAALVAQAQVQSQAVVPIAHSTAPLIHLSAPLEQSASKLDKSADKLDQSAEKLDQSAEKLAQAKDG